MTRVLNPAVTKLAGRRHIRFAARIRHVGRRSGREYVTPVGARLAGQTFVIPLTFGNQSDWSRNVRAAGGCSIRLGGTDYRAAQPVLADRAGAREVVRAAFSPVERAIFRLLGIRQYLLLQRAGGRTSQPPRSTAPTWRSASATAASRSAEVSSTVSVRSAARKRSV